MSNQINVGLIAPIPMLSTFATGPYHLLLSHLVDIPEYLAHYQKQSARGAWITLDNSAHEFGVPRAPEILLSQAVQLGAREIALPDVLCDYRGTVEATNRALAQYAESRELLDTHKIQLMFIPQGKTIYEWGRCFAEQCFAMESYFPDKPFAVGIPKMYEIWAGGLRNLVGRFAAPVKKKYGDSFDVHLLGWGRYMKGLGDTYAEFPWIRSTDSAKPFVYAMNNIEIDMMVSRAPVYPKRPADYFHKMMTDEEVKLAWANIDNFMNRVAGGWNDYR